MPSAELVGYSNLALYSAMAIFTVSMLLFAAYLAALGPVAAERGTARRSRQLVGAGAAAKRCAGTAPPERRAVVADAPSSDGAVAPGPQDRQHRALARLARHPAAHRVGGDARRWP